MTSFMVMKKAKLFHGAASSKAFSVRRGSMAPRKAMFKFGAARGMNTYLYAPVLSCEEIHEEKRQYGYKSLPPALAPRNSALHLTANPEGRPNPYLTEAKPDLH